MNKVFNNKMSLQPKDQFNVYICNHCHRITTFECKNTIDFSIISEIKDIGIDSIDLDFTVKCVDCNDYMFKCDSNLANKIRKLNELGVETLYCCSGHINRIVYPSFTDGDINFNISLPYIAFSSDLSNSTIDIIKALLLFQEYSFINFEDRDCDSDMYIIRAAVGTESIIDINSIIISEDEISEINEIFNLTQNKFFEFVDELIKQLEA